MEENNVILILIVSIAWALPYVFLAYRVEKFKYENYSLRHNNLDLKEKLLDLRQKHTELIAENAILKNQIIPGISAKVRSEINKRIEKEEG
jgi:hypothetical protein